MASAEGGGKVVDNTEGEQERVCWLPLESNPAMLNEFARRVGMPEKYSFNDVWGLDDGLTAMLPRPCFALTLLFKPSDKIGAFKREQREKIEQGTEANKMPEGDKLFFMKQYVGNACGTIATIHAIANADPIRGSLPTDSSLAKFFGECEGKSAEDCGDILGRAKYLHEVSESSASNTETGQTEAPAVGDSVDCHFIAFVQRDGCVFELDGGKAFPINHGPVENDFVQSAAQAIQQKFMQVDPDSIHWNIMALCEGTMG
jgi:ubiquitin carboxyl-terminal hydrolase L3